MASRPQHILITGGSSGIGLALAQLFAQQGAHLWLVARNSKRLEQAQQNLLSLTKQPGQRVEVFSADVGNLQQVQALAAHMQAEGVLPDVIINSAGIVFPGYAQNIPLATFEELMQVNYFGTVYICQAFLPGLLQRGSGHIVNISSVAGYLGVFGYTAYSASKFAVTGYTEALRAELKPRGVKVSIVFPPDTDTPQLAYETPLKPPETKALGASGGLMSAEAVAQAILRGLEGGDFHIFPNAQGKFFYRISGLFNEVLNAYGDWVIRKSQKTSKRLQNAT